MRASSTYLGKQAMKVFHNVFGGQTLEVAAEPSSSLWLAEAYYGIALKAVTIYDYPNVLPYIKPNLVDEMLTPPPGGTKGTKKRSNN